ncbi:MAG: hypothetical protein D6701_05575 [Gemmatimonadetes bacterium]|nr:MAG: hypothetical protein D6701_05575 [Gemmatimonadota bacterium]
MEVRSPAEVFAPLPEGYKPRDPRTTVLHRAVTEHLDGFLARASEEDPSGSGVPFHVERELRAYKKCGVLAFGFARVRCSDCGHEMLVGFSCKRRGFCPSCTARRASDCAAHLADRVLPHVPVRQWVLSFPRRVRWHLARDDKLLRKVIAIFHAELSRSYRRRAESDGVRRGQTGAVTFVQRFGSALNLNVHLHVVVPDGVFTLDDNDAERATFHKTARPEPGLTREVMLRTARRVLLLLEHHFDDVDGVSSFEPSVMDSLMARSIQTGQMPPGSGFAPRETDTASHAEGFSLHCGVRIHENDRQGLEHLLGYGGRGPLATSRLTQAADGRYAYSMRRPLPDGRTTLVLTGHELMGRLAALIPPPRVNMVRYHGVFAPKAKLRPFVVPEAPASEQGSEVEGPPIAVLKRPRSHGSYRLDWAALLQRVFDVDVLVCGKCGGRSKVIAVIKDGLTARKILDHLGLGDAQPANTQPTGPPQLDLPLAA